MKDTREVVNDLRAEGFRVNRGYVSWTIRDLHLSAPEMKVGGAFVWNDEDIIRLRQFLLRQGRGPEQLKHR